MGYYIARGLDADCNQACYWIIGSDKTPDRQLSHDLRPDIYRSRETWKYVNIPGFILAANIVIQALNGGQVWLSVVIACIVVIAGIVMAERSSVKMRDRERLAAYLAANSVRVISLNGSVGAAMMAGMKTARLDIEHLTPSESRLVDEYLAGLDVVEIDTILAAEGTETNETCVRLQGEVHGWSARVAASINALREDVRKLEDTATVVLARDAADCITAEQGQLSDRAARALGAIGR